MTLSDNNNMQFVICITFEARILQGITILLKMQLFQLITHNI